MQPSTGSTAAGLRRLLGLFASLGSAFPFCCMAHCQMLHRHEPGDWRESVRAAEARLGCGRIGIPSSLPLLLPLPSPPRGMPCLQPVAIVRCSKCRTSLRNSVVIAWIHTHRTHTWARPPTSFTDRVPGAHAQLPPRGTRVPAVSLLNTSSFADSDSGSTPAVGQRGAAAGQEMGPPARARRQPRLCASGRRR